MQHPGGGPDSGDGSPESDLSDLLAPADVQFRPPPAPARARRAPVPVPVPPVTTALADPPDLTRSAPVPAPLAPLTPPPPRPSAPLAAPPPAAAPAPAPAPAPAARVATAAPSLPAPPAAPLERSEDVVTFGRWFQPVAGGVLPRPDAAEPLVAVIRVAPGSTVHAVTAGRVRRAPVTLAAGGLELAGDDGTTVVLTGPARTAWVRDDEDVVAGEVVGVLPAGDDGADDAELRVLVIGPDGTPRDAVDTLVGLPDPGELDLGPGLGTDPFALDLEIAGRTDRPGAR
ncbi:hypothetical protein [Cellulomonas phragmiteti]|uniref:Uncharacterized protein n=1 Tax=Cellulomonas phragmiteti TaxID=478780 RepID=A0ABQ4DP79_9CELL|nr:hypothetical protein [Cellulomonas phragmiteti]GIG41160.1 hypothetical protein Cph01nite_29220 [Cellulomonas phragmiteti]